MSPWEFRVGQLVGYKPHGPKWRAKVTAVEREGKPHLAEIPVVDQSGARIQYAELPRNVNLITDFENYHLVEESEGASNPWLASLLDHQDDGGAGRKKLAERLGLRASFRDALDELIKRVPPELQDSFRDDMIVFVHASWREGRRIENGECARLLIDRCAENGVACCVNCTHYQDAAAVREKGKGI